jgi:hypothetical protein
MNDTALRMQADYVANAERTDRQTKNAVRVAVISLVISASGLIASFLFSYQSYLDSIAAGEKSDAQIKVFKDGIDTLVSEQRADRAALLKSLYEVNRSTPTAKK